MDQYNLLMDFDNSNDLKVNHVLSEAGIYKTDFQ